MKHTYCVTMLTLLLGIVTLAACSSDDADTLKPDINTPITGYWQIAGEDLNGDGAIQGIVVHDDGTVTDWIYTQASNDPYQLGFKTGKWTASGNHYEMQLSKGNGSFYTVTVAGNDDKMMYLAYNGKTSVIPFHRLSTLPGEGNKMIQELESMKMSGFTMSDLTGYWEMADGNNTHDGGFYIDEEGNVSEIGTIVGAQNYHTINYHTAKIQLNSYFCAIPLWGQNYKVYAVGNGVLLLTASDGQMVQRFERKEKPQEIVRMERLLNSPVSADWLGTWEAKHYTDIIDGRTITDEDITPEDDWIMQYYYTLEFTTGHRVKKTNHLGYSYDGWFSVEDNILTITDNLNAITTHGSSYIEQWSISSKTDRQMTLTRKSESTTEVYTYQRK